ncbi:MAG: sulfatase, partial [Thermoanaerobaculia bacterium]|nr:sulfatase [Thermoanaerobaculia bacterium]
MSRAGSTERRVAGRALRRIAVAAVCSAALLACSTPQSPQHERPPPNVLFVLVDTLRADFLGTYGHDLDTSPEIDRLAAEGYVFENAQSVSPWTNPAIATLFSGRYPDALIPPLPHRQAIGRPLPDDVETLAEKLQSRGYRTVGLVDHPGISPGLDFDQGFETFLHLFKEGGFDSWQVTDTGFVFDQVAAQLERPRDERPLFLYLHLVYPHHPYKPEAGYAEPFWPEGRVTRPYRRLANYRGEIRQTDALVGRIMAAVQDRGLDASTWLVLASDHGEGFWEHGMWEHGNSLFEELLRIPLILRPPGGRDEPVRIATRVSLVDVYPTLLDLAGAEAPTGLDGESLVPLLHGETLERKTPIFAGSPHSGDVERAAVYQGRFKYIKEAEHDLLYDLEADPGEAEPITDRAATLANLRSTVLEHQGRD